jgi:hypothetical protein
MRLARTADPFIHTFQAGRYSMQGSAALTLPSAPAFVQTGARSQTDWTREPENQGTYNRVHRKVKSGPDGFGSWAAQSSSSLATSLRAVSIPHGHLTIREPKLGNSPPTDFNENPYLSVTFVHKASTSIRRERYLLRRSEDASKLVGLCFVLGI